MEKKKLPIGIEDFEKLRNNEFYYADKTMFIAQLLQNWGEVNLFTRPRRFGKSLNMSMLKAFFEIGRDKTLFDGLQISHEKELCDKYMGKFPVISITLKGVAGLDFQQACDAMRTVIGDEASRFKFLLSSPNLDDCEKDSYKRLIRVNMESSASYDIPYGSLIDSLKTLSMLLARHYGSKVILLIDEYDVPLDKAFNAGYYDEMINLIRNMLGNGLKTNEHLFMAVLTGCLRISKESIFTGLNNLKVMTVSNPLFADAFGFTDDEVRGMLEYYGLEDKYETVRDWYDGYRFGNQAMYCPWDVINYCDLLRHAPDAEPENYWANSSGNDLVRRFIDKADQATKREIETLLQGGSIVKKVREELTYRDIDSTIDNIWSVLYSTGYLTMAENLGEKHLRLRLPNKEIREIFAEMADEWFQEMAGSDTARIGRFCNAFITGDADTIQEMLGEYLWDCISVRDKAVRKDLRENFYHGMLLGLLRSQGQWLIRSNAEAGEGYSDISIETRKWIGAVIEIKYADDGNLEAACERALQQIEEKHYHQPLLRDGMDTVLKYGIAFCGKRCRVMGGLK